MKKILGVFILIINSLSIYGLDNMAGLIKSSICYDSIFHSNCKNLKIYVWIEKLEKKDLYGELYALKTIPANKVKTEEIYKNFNLSKFYDFPLNTFKYKKIKSEKKWNGVLNNKCAVIHLSDVYKLNDSVAYCLIRVYAWRKKIDYNFFLKKVDDTWIIDEKYVISDFII